MRAKDYSRFIYHIKFSKKKIGLEIFFACYDSVEPTRAAETIGNRKSVDHGEGVEGPTDGAVGGGPGAGMAAAESTDVVAASAGAVGMEVDGSTGTTAKGTTA